MALVVANPSTLNGVTTYDATSAYNDNSVQVLRVLPPDSPAAGVPHRYVYLLPVEPDNGTTFGDGIAEAQGQDLHNTYNATFIMPGIEVEPWNGNHPSTATIAHDSFYALDLQPWVAANVAGGGEHWLVSFSKGGWSALSLIFRHPGLFARAGVWDVPFAAADTQYAASSSWNIQDVVGPVGGTNTYATYNPYPQDNLTAWNAGGAFNEKRVVMTEDEAAFGADRAAFLARLATAGITYDTADTGGAPQHSWSGSGAQWLPATMAALHAQHATYYANFIFMSPGGGRSARRYLGR